MPDDHAVDVPYMQQALQLAQGGVGFVSPNPLVGCVIVRDGVVVGQGYHQQFGGPHAEVHALQEAGTEAHGAVLYVTLEPCSHTGKTPPCADAVLRSGVRRVVAAMRDPNPLVAGQGLARLAAAGIAVTVGVCEAEARKTNEAFIKYITTRRPFVTLKSAITLDGKIATRTGASRWITGEAARQAGHQLRHAADAMLVGIGTVLQDDPLLTTRLPDRQGVNPLRVIVDSTLRVPLHSQVANTAPDRRTLVLTTARAAATQIEQLRARGVEVVCLQAYDDGRVDLEAALRALGERGIASVLVEGGATLSATLLQRRLIDKVVFFIAPKIIGSDGVSVVGACGVDTMEQVITLQGLVGQRLGDDVMLEAYLTV
ncbi:MAG: bifunctional diaminohydroxyphosphoribosylaminopyrimidine deaminase/5-amino-6-(5-phosphoribosylamino)uracil reductase RibD [Candidatus Tectomicrobia bacterium]|uniref:Riboflavin biosynthesis protein RibD n=1 Tax=Tectimicrobiota bacterium TaxID=2528274 RepID=A0A937W1H7_UNCTE|nr:bifunctional diaminohydroxyphosphoribosylaminopyrimidine deaminase/5-amino-6-(5-phosphoribosylamino)uracil reductase RibD [Candidatus Tectomicrobia bacterium]